MPPSIFTRLAVGPALAPRRRYETRLHLVYQRPRHNLFLIHRAMPNEPSSISGHLAGIGPARRSTSSLGLHLVLPNEPNPISGQLP
jgi:hypothetical protein